MTSIKLLLHIVFVFITFYYASAQAVNKKDPLTGTWQLIDFADTDSLGNWIHPFGKHPRGFVTYTATGIFNINMSSEIPLGITESESKTRTIILDEFLWKYSFGYFGNYAADLKKSVVTHKVTGGTIPWFVGTDQPRPFLLRGDTLIIGDNRTWKRVLIKAD